MTLTTSLTSPPLVKDGLTVVFVSISSFSPPFQPPPSSLPSFYFFFLFSGLFQTLWSTDYISNSYSQFYNELLNLYQDWQYFVGSIPLGVFWTKQVHFTHHIHAKTTVKEYKMSVRKHLHLSSKHVKLTEIALVSRGIYNIRSAA